MQEADIERNLKEFIRKEFMAGHPDVVLENDLSLIETGLIDSLGIFTLIAHLEESFGVKIASEDVVVENFETIETLKNLVLQRSR